MPIDKHSTGVGDNTQAVPEKTDATSASLSRQVQDWSKSGFPAEQKFSDGADAQAILRPVAMSDSGPSITSDQLVNEHPKVANTSKDSERLDKEQKQYQREVQSYVKNVTDFNNKLANCLGIDPGADLNTRKEAFSKLQQDSSHGDQSAADSLDRFNKLIEDQKPGLDREQQKLDHTKESLDHKSTVLSERENFKQNLDKIEDNPKLSAEQKKEVFAGIKSVLDDHSNLDLSQKRRSEVAAGVANDIANPGQCSQGHNPSCGEAAVANIMTLQCPERYASLIASAVTTGHIELNGNREAVLSNNALNAPEDPMRSPATNIFIRMEQRLITEEGDELKYHVDSRTGEEQEIDKYGQPNKFRGTVLDNEKALIEQFTNHKYIKPPSNEISKSAELQAALTGCEGQTILLGVKQGQSHHIMAAEVNGDSYTLMESRIGKAFELNRNQLFAYLSGGKGDFQLNVLAPER